MAGAITEMSGPQCRERLAEAEVGRVVLCTPAGPEVYPVNFAMVDGDVVFRTSPYTTLGAQLRGRTAAFEVDELHPERSTGWSVVVRGRAQVVEDPDEIASLRRKLPDPWAPGRRTLFVRIVTERVTGRLVSPPAG